MRVRAHWERPDGQSRDRQPRTDGRNLSRRARVSRRLGAVRLALLGHTAADVAERVLVTDRQVRAWVARYNGGRVGRRAVPVGVSPHFLPRVRRSGR